jgi:hypothetical protein
MRKEKMVIYFLAASCLIALAFRFKPLESPATRGIVHTGDTTSFVPNKSGGWDIISSYLNQDTPDSVEFDLILVHGNTVSFGNDQLIGAIYNKAFLPKTDQNVQYDLYRNNNWSVRINANGQCYLKQSGGDALKPSSLVGNPYVLPVKVRYKNN